ncbi:CPBP family intramembrane glutamic endopeptidase [Chryseobacterium sp. JV558]|uniref:CPBP family intramembrane glutamic endopeptidase n=1 Tax=Chryseobacterium sp. JV558 TaxID=2663236 RepID=UPI00299D299F|nr:CPBP family intramembrane glutamic endopeptidase [Chryseobacterium sp. JV558]MDW9381472.1 CPBP family intramembrane metalloprotease [Chryseobacterium sp. JV558]
MEDNKLNFRKKKVQAFTKVLLFYVCTIIILISASELTRELSKPSGDLLSVFIAMLTTFLLTVLFVRWDHIKLSEIGVTPGKLMLRRLFTGFIIGLLLAILQALIVMAFGHLKLRMTSNFNWGTIVFFLFFYVLIAVREELVFRSYLLRTLDYKFKAVFALSVMIILFIFEHILSGMSWKMSIIGSGLGGLLFGIAALKTRGIALPIALHTSWNFGQWVTGFKNQSGIWNAVVDRGYEIQTENIGLAAFVLVMLLTICILSSRRISL